jgi:hypothetical protein
MGDLYRLRLVLPPQELARAKAREAAARTAAVARAAAAGPSGGGACGASSSSSGGWPSFSPLASLLGLGGGRRGQAGGGDREAGGEGEGEGGTMEQLNAKIARYYQ